MILGCVGLTILGSNVDDTKTASEAAAPAKKAVTTYRALTAREWQLVAKSPDTYTGNGYVLYGVVTQADAAIGNEAFLAEADGVQQPNVFGYTTNTVFVGEPKTLADIVKGDQFVAKVTAQGSYSYDTQVGGNTTAPRMHVDSITVTTPAQPGS